MAFDSSKTSSKLFRVLLAFVLAVALIPLGAHFDSQASVSALESAEVDQVLQEDRLRDGQNSNGEGERTGADGSGFDAVAEGAGADDPGVGTGQKDPIELPNPEEPASEAGIPLDLGDDFAMGSEGGTGDESSLEPEGEQGDESTVDGEGEPGDVPAAGGEDEPSVESAADGEGEFEGNPEAESESVTENAAEDEPDSAALSRVIFSVEGEGRLEVMLADGSVEKVGSGEELSIEQQVGTFVLMRGIPAEGVQLDAVVTTLDAQTQVKTEEERRFEGASFEKELTFSPSDKIVKLRFEEQASPIEELQAMQPLALMRAFSLRSASAGNSSQPEVGDQFSGSATVRARNIVSAGGRVADITVDPTSGILSELSSLTTYCAHHSAASPLVGFSYSYTFTVTSVNKETGEVRGTFYGVSNTSPTDGVSRDSRGRLTGYQALEGEAVIWRTYPHGGISISKSLVGGDASELEGIAFEIYDDAGRKVSFTLPDGSTSDQLVLDKNGRAQTTSDALLAGSYTVVEVESSVPDGVISYAKAQGMGSSVVARLEVANHQGVYPVELVNYKKPQLGLIKVDGDSLAEAESGSDAGAESDAGAGSGSAAGSDSGSEPAAGGGSDVGSESGSASGPGRVAGSTWALERKSGDAWIEIERHITGEDGTIRFSDQAISQWGSYRLVELEPANADSPDGYMSRESSHGSNSVEFTIDASTWDKFASGAIEGEAGDGWEYSMVDGTPALVHTASNWRYRDVEVVKLDEQTGEPLSQTHYSLWRYLGEGRPAEADRVESSHGVYATDPSESLDPQLWELVSRGETDDQGSLMFRGLAFGYYLVVEEMPNPAYAEWWESAESSWGSYCLEVGEDERFQVQTFENRQITLETTVSKSTIAKTSAAFVSLPGQNVSFDNVGVERYRYDVSFTNGETNVRADQYSVIDECDFTDLGMRLTSLWTPVVSNDTDGTFNLWFRTNQTDAQTVYSSASATAANPENLRADGTNRISTVGWRLWSADLPAQERTQLSTADLGLAEDEYITGLLLEYGSVEVGFGTLEPLSYLVVATEKLMDDQVIYNSVSSHITRNWRVADGVEEAGEEPAGGGADGGASGGADGLYDDAYDQVQTTVLETMSYEPTESTWQGSSAVLSQTGDDLAVLFGAFALAMATGALGLGLALWRRRKLKQV